MRDARIDELGEIATSVFRKSGLSMKEFIQNMVKTAAAFDTTESTFHTVDRDDIVSYYFANGRWFAKY